MDAKELEKHITDRNITYSVFRDDLVGDLSETQEEEHFMGFLGGSNIEFDGGQEALEDSEDDLKEVKSNRSADFDYNTNGETVGTFRRKYN